MAVYTLSTPPPHYVLPTPLTTTAARRMVYPITHQHSLPPFAIGASSFVADGVQTGSKNRLIVVVVSASYSSHIPPQNRRRRPAMVESLFVYPIRIRLLRLSGVIVFHIEGVPYWAAGGDVKRGQMCIICTQQSAMYDQP